MKKDKRLDELKERLVQEIQIAVGNHFDVYVDPLFIRDLRKSVDDLASEISKISHK